MPMRCRPDDLNRSATAHARVVAASPFRRPAHRVSPVPAPESIPQSGASFRSSADWVSSGSSTKGRLARVPKAPASRTASGLPPPKPETCEKIRRLTAVADCRKYRGAVGCRTSERWNTPTGRLTSGCWFRDASLLLLPLSDRCNGRGMSASGEFNGADASDALQGRTRRSWWIDGWKLVSRSRSRRSSWTLGTENRRMERHRERTTRARQHREHTQGSSFGTSKPCAKQPLVLPKRCTPPAEYSCYPRNTGHRSGQAPELQDLTHIDRVLTGHRLQPPSLVRPGGGAPARLEHQTLTISHSAPVGIRRCRAAER